MLCIQWSPEQIASKLPISHETVYQHVYADKAQGGTLWNNLRCQKQKRKRYASCRDRRGQIPNRRPLSERPLHIEARLQVGHWECDTVIGASHKGAVVGWSMQSNMTSQLVADALMMAVWRRGKPEELLHHSDQGSQYSSEHFQKLLSEQGITCSMSRAGEVWDNSAMESFFSTLKIERVHRKVYRTRAQARADVFDFIEIFYNPKRRHSTIGYISPVKFEEALFA